MRTLLSRFPAQLVLAAVLGSCAVLGYAPFYFYPAPILALAGLFWLWTCRVATRDSALLGFAFGLGLFGSGVSWIYVSLHDFGGMPMAFALFATAAFCAFIALLPLAAGWAFGRFFHATPLLAAPLLWSAQEWVRGWIFTGFPWLTVGYSQVPYSPLAGFFPLFGAYGVSLLCGICAALIAAALAGRIGKKTLVLGLLALWVSGALLKQVEWSRPYGPRVSFSLLQGNIAQDLKWREDELVRTLETYERMVRTSTAQLIVLPEMALPILLDDLPQRYLEGLAEHARSRGGDVLVGVPEIRRDGEDIRYYNSVLSYGSAPTQAYRKYHLVPFGEFIPLKPVFGWIYRELLHIPLADLAPGEPQQTPMSLSGQKIALNICYEDVFGEEIIRPLPEATLLVNLSNDAWYGDSLAADQHLQMSQARALETARMMLRSTNTGATAVIDREGRVVAQIPHFIQASLDGEAQGYAGETPYVRWGNWPVIMLLAAGILGLGWRQRSKGRSR